MTRCTRGAYLVHAAIFVVATRTVVTYIEIYVTVGGTCEAHVSTANLVRIGPHCLGIVTGIWVEPGNMKLLQEYQKLM
jgi:hypothetical protein